MWATRFNGQINERAEHNAPALAAHIYHSDVAVTTAGFVAFFALVVVVPVIALLLLRLFYMHIENPEEMKKKSSKKWREARKTEHKNGMNDWTYVRKQYGYPVCCIWNGNTNCVVVEKSAHGSGVGVGSSSSSSTPLLVCMCTTKNVMNCIAAVWTLLGGSISRSHYFFTFFSSVHSHTSLSHAVTVSVRHRRHCCCCCCRLPEERDERLAHGEQRAFAIHKSKCKTRTHAHYGHPNT